MEEEAYVPAAQLSDYVFGACAAVGVPQTRPSLEEPRWRLWTCLQSSSGTASRWFRAVACAKAWSCLRRRQGEWSQALLKNSFVLRCMRLNRNASPERAGHATKGQGMIGHAPAGQSSSLRASERRGVERRGRRRESG